MPAGSDGVVMVSTGRLIVSDSAAVVEFDTRSLARTVKLLDPAAPGVPDNVLSTDRLNPAGNDPLTKNQE